MRCASAARLFRDTFIPARPRVRPARYNLLIPVIERARGARWAGQAAETGEFPDVTVKAAGICPSAKQEPVWRAAYVLRPGPHRLQTLNHPFNTRSDAAHLSPLNTASELGR
ncbi:MAG: hypothetical protein ACT6RN_21415 [Agrobacterium sp.]|uniref:hypothetical protein n=1 Tax=Agrobacterium sp. TaxID=361 RepID=UPI00403790B1